MSIWTLIDVTEDVYVEHMHLTSAKLPKAAKGAAIVKRVLRGGLRDGVEVVEVNNGKFCFTVLAGRGMGIWRASLDTLRLGWDSPARGPVHPRHVNLHEPGGLGWLSGFDELLCRCGLENHGGPVFDEQSRLQYPLHGRIANTPAHKLEVEVDPDTGEIAVTGVMDEARLFHANLRLESTVRTLPGEPGLRITDRVTNLSGNPGELQLLYHINFGRPLLEPGARAVAPARTVYPCTSRSAEGVQNWDLYEAPQAGFTEQVYFFELASDAAGNTETLLHNAAANQGASIRFNVQQLPTFTTWKCTQAEADGYVTGLEPGLNLPIDRTHEAQHGRIPQLAPGETREFQVELQAHGTAESVAAATKRIKTLQGDTAPHIHTDPQPGWGG